MDQLETSLLLDMSLDDIIRLQKSSNPKATSTGKPLPKQARTSSFPKPYSSETKVCLNCLKPGHARANCPETKVCNVCGSADHVRAVCPSASTICAICNQAGHVSSRCLANVLGRSETGPSDHCFVCGSKAHKKAECPHANKACDVCKKVGHLRAMCKQINMPPGTRAAMVAAVGKPILPESPDRTAPVLATNPKPCFACGSVAHQRKDCPHKLQVCELCGKQGHFASLCKMRKQNT
jgi:hypothetical protein